MRQIVLDTETTGLDPAEGHRIIEIGCCELVNRRPTERYFHRYLQPDREIDPKAVEIHGITNDFLQDKPHFADIVEEFLAFVRGAELIIHNAPFDVGFINHELSRLPGKAERLQDYCKITDTLALARRLYPGQKNSLDALCQRHAIDHSDRLRHGALLDTQILCKVYLAMTGGQVSMQLDKARPPVIACNPPRKPGQRPPLMVLRASAEELQIHAERLEAIERASGGRCLWKRVEAGDEYAAKDSVPAPQGSGN